MQTSGNSYPVAMTIAGSDSSGGAGIQADLKTFAALQVTGTSVLTALTAQNRFAVNAVLGLEADFVKAQTLAVLADMEVRACKTGMLYSADIIYAVNALWQAEARAIPLVIDPVMVATSGARLLDQNAEQAMRNLCQQAFLITPNIPEALVLMRKDTGVSEQLAAHIQKNNLEILARQLGEELGCKVLLKGGHLRQTGSDEIINFLYDGTDVHDLHHTVVQHRSIHGTGCTLSAAITAELAKGQTLADAVQSATDYLLGALRASPADGKEIGILNHHWQSNHIQ